MKTPIERVMELYQKRGFPNPKFGERSFEKDLKEYTSNGIVINTPTCFAMLKALDYRDGRVAWFIQAAAGKVSEIISQVPVLLPLVAFCRFNDKNRRMRFYSTERFIPKVMKLC